MKEPKYMCKGGDCSAYHTKSNGSTVCKAVSCNAPVMSGYVCLNQAFAYHTQTRPKSTEQSIGGADRRTTSPSGIPDPDFSDMGEMARHIKLGPTN